MKDAGIASCHSQERILFYTAGSRNGVEGVAVVGTHTQKEVDPKIRDVKQGQKITRDLLESIMKPTDPVKEELRRSSSKLNQFRHQIKEFRVSTFWTS